MRDLAATTWTDLADTAAASVLVLPVGSTEQHGPHLPCTVDTEIAVELARRLAAERAWAVVAPPVAYGSSGEHAAFPGTLSIGQRAVELLVTELVRSADAFAAVLVVSGHGGNAVPLRRAVATATREGRRAVVWAPRTPAAPAPTTWTPVTRTPAALRSRGGDAHAGRTETSVMLALRPGAVRVADAAAGPTAPLAELMPALTADGVRAVSPNGVLGDPAGASAAEGHAVLDAWAADLVAAADGLAAAAGVTRPADRRSVIGRSPDSGLAPLTP